MNRIILIGIAALASLSLLFSGCQKKKVETSKIVAKINGYYMTEEDLRDKMAHSPYSNESAQDLEDFLGVAIREQVLIQEAQRQGLDKSRAFMRTIERYWAQTLIKELLDWQSLKIYNNVRPDKRDEAMDAWVEELYKKADIKIYKDVLEEIEQVK